MRKTTCEKWRAIQLSSWGASTLKTYRKGLVKTFNDLAGNQSVGRYFSRRFPQLLVTRYRYHYIFYVVDAAEKPAVIGVIHEKRDIVNRLAERLG
jgi:toxin ParE1/3/4